MKSKRGSLTKSELDLATVTICSLEHRHVWGLTSHLMLEHVDASDYYLFVPEKQISAFNKITPEKFTIYSQEDLGKDYMGKLHKKMSTAENLSRLGWYAQQFHKINALRQLNQSKLAIWDADCVPVREVALYDAEGKPIYMMASEQNPDYFELISRLLGMKKIVDCSFVIPGFPILNVWVSEFIKYLEELHQDSWFDSILNNVDFKKRSGFSETETLGTWLSNVHLSEMKFQNLSWDRSGQTRFGYAKRMSPTSLKQICRTQDLDIVSFENWDVIGWRRIKKRMSKLLKG